MSIHSRFVSIALVMIAVSGTVAYAQGDSAAQAEVRGNAFQNLTTLPTIGSPNAPGFSVSFDATAAEKVGSVAVVVAPKHRDDFTFSVSASGPLSESTKSAQPLSLDGLANSAKAEAGLHWFLWRGTVNIAEGKAICKRNVGREDCDDNQITDPDERLLFLRSQAADTDPITLDVEGEYARTQFKYLNPGVYTPAKDSHSSATFSASVGRFTPGLGYLWGGYEFAHAWQAAGAPRQICTPLSTTALECVTSTVGAPSDSDEHILQFGWRRFLFHGRAAIDPVLEWNPGDEVAAVSLPVYGFTKKNEGLAGGVKVGWRSDTDDVTAVVFVGTAIGILK